MIIGPGSPGFTIYVKLDENEHVINGEQVRIHVFCNDLSRRSADSILTVERNGSLVLAWSER